MVEDGEIVVLSQFRDGQRFSVFSWEGEPLDAYGLSHVGGGLLKGVICSNRSLYAFATDLSSSRSAVGDLETMLSAQAVARITMSRTGVAAPAAYTPMPHHDPIEFSVTIIGPTGESGWPHPFQQWGLWSVAADGTWAALTQDSLAVRVSTFEGKTLFELPMPAPEKTTRDDLRLARDYMKRWNPENEIGEIEAVMKLPVYSVYLDPHRRLWVSRTPLVEIRARKKWAVVDVYSLSGEAPFSVRLPEGLEPRRPWFVVKGNRALGIVKDGWDQKTIVICGAGALLPLWMPAAMA